VPLRRATPPICRQVNKIDVFGTKVEAACSRPGGCDGCAWGCEDGYCITGVGPDADCDGQTGAGPHYVFGNKKNEWCKEKLGAMTHVGYCPAAAVQLRVQ